MRKIKEKDIRIENWCGYDIRWVCLKKGRWYAVLKDLCDALNLKTFHARERLETNMVEKVVIPTVCDIGSTDTTSDHCSNGVTSSRARKSQQMVVVNELGIYKLLFASRKVEAQKFVHWTFNTLEKLRKQVGLEGYEILRMTDREVQDEIDFILDSLYWDPEKKCVMQSVTVQGGDVEQRFYSR